MMLAEVQGFLSRSGRHDVIVEPQICMWNCTKPCSVVVQDDQRFSYITGSNTPDALQAEAIVQWFDLHGESADGQVPFMQWPPLMRGHFIARIPPAKI